eukprot:scaffold12843_cov113-Isochrysis_galbana.AAC.11
MPTRRRWRCPTRPAPTPPPRGVAAGAPWPPLRWPQRPRPAQPTCARSPRRRSQARPRRGHSVALGRPQPPPKRIRLLREVAHERDAAATPRARPSTRGAGHGRAAGLSARRSQ